MKKILINETIFDKTLPYQDWFIEENMPSDVQIVEIDDKYYADCRKEDFDVDNDEYSFNLIKYNTRLEKEKQAIANEEYENKIVALIRQKYNVNQELAILRQRDTKPEEFAEYNEYVEQCKKQVKNGI